MHVGMTTFFQNIGYAMSDAAVYAHEMSMADLAEPLGFDSLWSAEHHFDDYTMCPNVAQFLTYMAGRTRKVKLGSMVMVLPWHDPVRLAEEVSVLDHLSGGRVILGIGRGLGRIEFRGFRLNMGESRARFAEYAQAILQGLETGHIEYDGEYLKQPKVAIRPAPIRSFADRTYAASVSPASLEIMSRLGIGLLIIAQKPWETTVKELTDYRARFRQVNGRDAPKPIIASFIAVAETEAEAREMFEKYIRGYAVSAVQHYEFHNEGSPTSPATNITASSLRTSASTASAASLIFSPSCRSGARPIKSSTSSPSTSALPTAAACSVRSATAACRTMWLNAT